MSRDPHDDDPTGLERRHVALVGMAGVGKSSVARRLATAMGRPWHDLDAAVTTAEHRTVAEIFEDLGEERFRDLESAELAAALASDRPSVIATGGGVVERPENRAALDAAVVVWLRADDDVLVERLTNSSVERPLLGDDIAGRVATLTARRADWYSEVADVVVDVGSADVAGAVDAVRRALRSVAGQRP